MKKIGLPILLFFLILGLVSCGQKKSKDSLTANWLILAKDTQSSYQIVIPDSSSKLFNEACALADEIRSATGVQLPIVDDSDSTTDFEIVIGITSRETPQNYISELQTPDDYFVCTQDNKIFLYGSSEQAVSNAISVFRTSVVDVIEEGVMKIDQQFSQIFHSSNQYLTLVEVQTSDYVIACKEEHEEYAKELQNIIKENFGVTLSIVHDISSAEKAILIGDMACSEGQTACENLPAVFDSGIVVIGEKVVLAANYDSGLSNAVETFRDSIKSYTFKEKLLLPTNYLKIYDMESEDMVDYLPLINSQPSFMEFESPETVRIYTPDGSDDAWYYSHHPFMTEFQGKLYAIYSSGRINEDDCGQRIMMATSENFTDWDVNILVDSIHDEGYLSERVLYCTGIYSNETTLTVFFTSLQYDDSEITQNSDGTYLRPASGTAKLTKRKGPYYIQTTDGKTWSEAKLVEGNLDNKLYCGNLSPVALQSGRMMWAGYGSVAYTDDSSLQTGWNGTFIDLAEGEEAPNAKTESALFQHENGTVFLFSRTDGGTVICAASTDEGETWTDFYHTDMADYGAKFEFGTLPDGRYYCLGNTDTGRKSLVLMISEDGINFNEHYVLADADYTQMRTGLYKLGVYGYPTTYFDNKYMYVIYSLRKESVQVMRIPLSDIGVQ